MRHRSRPPVALTAAALVFAVLIHEASAEDAAGRLESYLERLDTVSADFEQVTINAENRVVQQNSGHLWVHSPDRFRVETTAPFAQTLVSDGDNFWSFDRELAQVVVRKLEENVAEVPILILGGRAEAIADAWEVDMFEDEDGRKFVLSPRDPGAVFESMTLSFADGMPQTIGIRDSLGQRTRIDLKNVTVNEPVAAGRFVLEIPDGVDVIDDRTPS